MVTLTASNVKDMNAIACSDSERHHVIRFYHNVHFTHSGIMDSVHTRLEGSSPVNPEKRVSTSCEGRACLGFRPFIWVACIIASHLHACRILNTPRNHDSYVQVPAASKAGLTLSPGVLLPCVRTNEYYESFRTTTKLHIVLFSEDSLDPAAHRSAQSPLHTGTLTKWLPLQLRLDLTRARHLSSILSFPNLLGRDADLRDIV